MGDEVVRVDGPALEALCSEAFASLGVPEDEAACQAAVLVEADARGIPSHGVARLPRYIAGLETGQMAARVERVVVRESPSSLLVDARRGLGAPVSSWAMRTAIDKARVSGMAFASVRNSNHFGIAGHYAAMAVGEDMFGLAMTDTAALGVPTFGSRPMFGTNPLAFAAPAGRMKAFLLDMSTTVVTRGKVETYQRLGKLLPEGWALDKEGRAAREPAPLLADMLVGAGGGIAPLGGLGELFGGYKGYGLAAMVEILTGLISGGAFGAEVKDTALSSATVSHCFAAMRIDLFQEPALFKARMDEYLESLVSSPKAEGAERIYYAGLKEAEAAEESALNGVALERGVFERLGKIAEARGLGKAWACLNRTRRKG